MVQNRVLCWVYQPSHIFKGIEREGNASQPTFSPKAAADQCMDYVVYISSSLVLITYCKKTAGTIIVKEYLCIVNLIRVLSLRKTSAADSFWAKKKVARRWVRLHVLRLALDQTFVIEVGNRSIYHNVIFTV